MWSRLERLAIILGSFLDREAVDPEYDARSAVYRTWADAHQSWPHGDAGPSEAVRAGLGDLGSGLAGLPVTQPCEVAGQHMTSLNIEPLPEGLSPEEEFHYRRHLVAACLCEVPCDGRAAVFAAIGGGSWGAGAETFLCAAHSDWLGGNRWMRGPASGVLFVSDETGHWRRVGG